MRKSLRLICSLVLFFFLFNVSSGGGGGFVSAQVPTAENPARTPAAPPDSEKDKARQELEKNVFKLLDDAVGDAGGLKLWENRALIYAVAGDLYWKTDQKHARRLFRDAANEIISGNQMPKEKPKNYWEEYSYWQELSPRRAVLLLIAARDADLALTLLLETRPPDLQAAINALNQPKPPPPPASSSSSAAAGGASTARKTAVEAMNEQKNKFKVQQEIALEQQFAVKAAESDPKKAAKLLRDSLSKGVSQAAIQLLTKINEKDEELGKELLGEVIGKILDADFAEKDDAQRVANYLLIQSANAALLAARNDKFKQLKIEDKDLRSIAGKLADHFARKLDMRNYWSLGEVMTALEKYAPEKIAPLKQKEAALKKLIPEEQRGWQEVGKLVSNPDAKPEQFIAEAGKYAGYEKYQLYQTAVDKSLPAGTGDKIRELLKAEPPGKQRDDALEYLDSKLTEKAIKDDKFDDAQNILARAESASSKVRILVDLAVGLHKKNTKESREKAADLMNQARALVGDAPESRQEMNDILKIAAGYAVVDPDRAFPYLAPLVEMNNDLMTAYSLLAKYSRQEYFFKNGEMIITQALGFTGAYAKYGKELGLLAAADFGRTRGLIEQFRRYEVRALLKLLTAQSVFKEKIGVDGADYFFVSDY